MDITALKEKQDAFFSRGDTLSYSFRINALKKMKQMMSDYEGDFINALQEDLCKAEIESIFSELLIVAEEIKYFIKHLKNWMKPSKVKRSLLTFDSKSYIIHKPYGSSLIISPFNYPVQISLLPAIGAIASGNCIILKPSEFTPNVSLALEKAIKNTFDEEYFAVVTGGLEETKQLLSLDFKKMFFTGSTNVGKIVLQHSVKNLASTTLELGGKSPVIIDNMNEASLNKALKRIINGKFINSGQTCIAPDYLLVDSKLKGKFLNVFIKNMSIFESERKMNPIVNEAHYNRIKAYLGEGKVLYGGTYDDSKRSIEMTLLEPKSIHENVMRDEIFGPVLPIIYFDTIEDARRIALEVSPEPLALYVFSSDKNFNDYFVSRLSFGGCSINDTISHILNPRLPFGGVGASGIGSYHGYESFKAFSKTTSLSEKGYGLEASLKYPPYSKSEKFIRFLYKLFKR